LIDQWKFFKNPRFSARVELAEMISGLLLAVFMWGHMAMLSTIIFGEETMDGLAVFLEDYYISQVGVVGIALLILLHFVAAGRKLPSRVKEQAVFWRLARKLRHGDTWLWLVQVITGMLMLIFAAIHLFVLMTTFPIEAQKSATRVAQAFGWLYAPMVLLIELHLGIGFYRIIVKWTSVNRRAATAIKWLITIAFLVLGYWILRTFWAHGLEHLK
jgi:fumarate reductase subunit C